MLATGKKALSPMCLMGFWDSFSSLRAGRPLREAVGTSARRFLSRCSFSSILVGARAAGAMLLMAFPAR